MSALTDLNNNIPQQSPAAVGYFVDQKKGEVNELKQVIIVVAIVPFFIWIIF